MGLAPVIFTLVAAPASAAEDFQAHLDNAKLFIKKQFWDDAVLELEKAVALDDGRIDPEAWYMLATVRFELCDLEGARDAAARAHSFSRSDDQLQQAAGFSAYLTDQFGVLVVAAPYAGLTTRLDVELESVIFDPNLKLYLAKLQATRLEKKVMVPTRVGLPAGTYRVNGKQVTVPPATEVVLELSGTELGARGPVGTQLAQAEVALGVSAWVLGQPAHNLLPTVNGQLAFSQPVGPVIAGLMVDWAPRPYVTADDAVTWSPWAWSLGARVGVELPDTQPLVVRASAGYRFAAVPGVELGCLGGDTGFRCTLADPEAEHTSDLYVYAVGRAHVPLVELSVDYLDRSRTTTVGVGVKAVVEQAFGTVPADAEAVLPSGERLEYEVLDGARAWTGTGLRALVNLSLAF